MSLRTPPIAPPVAPLGAALITALCVAPIAPASETYDVDARSGYRMERYRAPVPDSVPGGVTLDTAAVRALVARGSPVLVDVFPPKGMGADPLDGRWLVSEAHATLPGAVWLPEVGRGFLDDGHEAYFRRNLERLSGGDAATPMVFFCTADCWQSWNAAKRASDWGYTGVHWYPLGTDGWSEEGGELVPARPLNFLDDAPQDAPPGAGPTSNAPSVAGTDAAVPPHPTVFPTDDARIALVDGEGVETDIGSVRFEPDATGEAAAIAVTIDGGAFSDHFLSMRPFRCVSGAAEWFCHLPYPYPLADSVTADDLTDLEYRLLFIVKSADEFGIDAWNGIYYRLSPDGEGGFEGALLEGDLNVLAVPPDDPTARPIDLDEFIDEEAARRRFPTLVIRP